MTSPRFVYEPATICPGDGWRACFVLEDRGTWVTDPVVVFAVCRVRSTSGTELQLDEERTEICGYVNSANGYLVRVEDSEDFWKYLAPGEDPEDRAVLDDHRRATPTTKGSNVTEGDGSDVFDAYVRAGWTVDEAGRWHEPERDDIASGEVWPEEVDE